MIYRLTMIHINIYYGEPLSNTNPYDGLMFQGPGIQCYYMTMININIYYGGPFSNANTELVARPHQFDWHLRQLPCITLCTTMQGKHSPNYTEVDCKGPSTSVTTSYAPYRQTCRRKLCLLGVLKYKHYAY